MRHLKEEFEAWVQKVKGRPARPGEYLEAYVTFMYESLLIRHAKNIEVKHRASVPDNRGNLYEIDVFFEFELAGNKHRVAIECKEHKRPVTRDNVIAFCGKVQEMPSTIGVFISMSGFQAGALKYLDDNGVQHMDGRELPHFGKLVGERLAVAALPDESAFGQPFWTVMEAVDGKLTGNWTILPPQGIPAQLEVKDKLVPLFFSRREAERYRLAVLGDGEDSCLRGVEQPMLRAMIGIAKLSQISFAVFQSIEVDEKELFEFRVWTPPRLEKEFVC